MQQMLLRLRPGRTLAVPAPVLRGWAALERWATAERGQWALWLPVLMAAGAAAYLSWGEEPPGWLGAATLAVGVAVTAAARARLLRGAGLVVLAAGLGFGSAQFAAWRAPPLLDVPRRAVILRGVVRVVEALPNGRRVVLERPGLDTQEGGHIDTVRTIRVRLHAGDPVVAGVGDTLQLRALLSAPAAPDLPGGWDVQRDAFFAGVGAYGFALGPATVLAAAPPPDGFARALEWLRATVADRVRAVLDGAEGAIAVTLLTGETSGIPATEKAAFRDSGLAHLLAIAGLHVGIVMGLTFGLVRLALAAWERAALTWNIKAAAAVAALLAGGCYMLLTGAHVPIMRSFAMAALVTLAVLARRRAVALRGLGLAMAALLLIAPNEVLGVSFQMSFSAVLALIAGYAALRPWLRALHGDGAWWRRAAGHVAGLAITSALAGTASAPFAAYHFGRLQIYFVVANMMAVPLTALWVMPLGMLALLLMPLSLEWAALLPMGWGIAAIDWIGRSVAAWPQAVLAVPHLPAWGLAMVAVGIAWLGIFRTRVRLAGALALAAGLGSAAMVRPPDALMSADGRLIGIRTRAGVFFDARPGVSTFTRDAWQQYWASGPPLPLPDGADGSGALACDATACRMGGLAVLRAPGAAVPCDAALVLGHEPLHAHCSAPVAVLDRFSVWREGAAAIWFGPDGVRVVTEASLRGVRPWAPAPGHAHSAASLPLAPTDPPPAE